MKNIQVIDDAVNAAYDIYCATDDEFQKIFPRKGQDIEFADTFCKRVGNSVASDVLDGLWKRRMNKKEVVGIHGTLFFGLPEKKKFYKNKQEPVLDGRPVPDAWFKPET